MNIFYLDPRPKVCAKFHNDKHVVKMIVETAQLLCGAHWSVGSNAPYKSISLNHPCAKWVRKDLNNYKWLCELGINLCEEYEARYGKTHKTKDVILWCQETLPKLPSIAFSEPPQAMPDEYKVEGCSVRAYRNYYLGEKISFSTWRNGQIPNWIE